MGVGVNVISIRRAYIVLLYGLHFNFASCVYCYAAEPQCGHRTATHMTMGDEKQFFGLYMITFFFQAPTIAQHNS